MSLETPILPGNATATDTERAGPSARSAPAPRPTPWLEVWVGVLVLAAIVATAALVATHGIKAGLFVRVLCLGTLVLAAGFDAATGRIPNPLTYNAVLLGLSVNCLGLLLKLAAPRMAEHWLGAAGPTQALLGLLVFGGVGLVCKLLSGMGGGDMKLLAAVGAMLGLSRASDVLGCALVVAVVYSVVNLLIAGRLNATVRAAAVQALNLVFLRDPAPTVGPSRRTIPLAVPVLLGMLLSALPPVAAATKWVKGIG
jgi:prepilin peptidase CpaA